MDTEKPAILGGTPVFKDLVPIIQPTLPDLDSISNNIRDILTSKMITNHKYVSLLEQELKTLLEVKNVVAISNCTSGMMICLKALKLTGEIITPSFSFSATSLAILWAGLKPIFADCHPTKWTIDTENLINLITPKTSGIIATHVFGNPCDINTLEQICQENNLRLIFDSAHGAGSIYRGKRIGNFGNAESFSMSPTKVLTAGEGGMVTTNDDKLADQIRIGRNYGNPGDYNTQLLGLSARMAEFSAILALESLKMLKGNVEKRQELVEIYKRELHSVPGIRFQEIEEDSISSYKDVSILINEAKFGVSRNLLYDSLEKENIMTKKYFDPPIHEQDVFKSCLKDQKLYLGHTDYISKNILSLPIYSHMSDDKVMKICHAIKRVHEFHEEIKEMNR